eukprot:15025748-Alexandrium_andersonii.AAC.1
MCAERLGETHVFANDVAEALAGSRAICVLARAWGLAERGKSTVCSPKWGRDLRRTCSTMRVALSLIHI